MQLGELHLGTAASSQQNSGKWAEEGERGKKPSANKCRAAEITDKCLALAKPPLLMQLWAANGMGSKRELASSAWILKEKMDVCEERAQNDEMRRRKMLHIYLHRSDYRRETATADFASVPTEAGFPFKAKGIHVNKQQWAAWSSQRYKKPSGLAQIYIMTHLYGLDKTAHRQWLCSNLTAWLMCLQLARHWTQ